MHPLAAFHNIYYWSPGWWDWLFGTPKIVVSCMDMDNPLEKGATKKTRCDMGWGAD
jgi:hypothetical protein